MSQPVVLFCHIPKTAGSTLERIIRSQYADREILRLYKLNHEQAVPIVHSLPERVRIIAGHVPAGFARYVSRPCHLITILRDPVECALSHYFYVARCPTHHLYEGVSSGTLSLADTVKMLRNRQALYISGQAKEDTELPEDQLLARAKENLRTGIAAFGLMERFDETLVLFNRALGWNVSSYVRENVTSGRPSKEQTGADQIQAVQQALGVDLELYTFAKELFEERIRQQPGDFASELENLKTGCQRAERLQRIRRRFTFWRS